jgi:hypothetical protein
MFFLNVVSARSRRPSSRRHVQVDDGVVDSVQLGIADRCVG